MTVRNRKQEYRDESVSINQEEKVMKALQSGETYKYLRIEQGQRTETGIVKERYKKI